MRETDPELPTPNKRKGESLLRKRTGALSNTSGCWITVVGALAATGIAKFNQSRIVSHYVPLHFVTRISHKKAAHLRLARLGIVTSSLLSSTESAFGGR